MRDLPGKLVCDRQVTFCNLKRPCRARAFCNGVHAWARQRKLTADSLFQAPGSSNKANRSEKSPILRCNVPIIAAIIDFAIYAFPPLWKKTSWLLTTMTALFRDISTTIPITGSRITSNAKNANNKTNIIESARIPMPKSNSSRRISH
jgi:hypothetical protein